MPILDSSNVFTASRYSSSKDIHIVWSKNSSHSHVRGIFSPLAPTETALSRRVFLDSNFSNIGSFFMTFLYLPFLDRDQNSAQFREAICNSGATYGGYENFAKDSDLKSLWAGIPHCYSVI